MLTYFSYLWYLNAEDLVTLQPGEERGNGVPDLHAGGWKEFVCFVSSGQESVSALHMGALC